MIASQRPARAFRRFPCGLLLPVCLGAAFGGDPPGWESIPYREPVPARCVAARGESVWIGDAIGLRASADAGETWTTLASLPGSDTVSAVYAGEGYLLAARAGSVYRSADSGRTWRIAGGDPLPGNGRLFEADGDTLFLFAGPNPPYGSLVSLDQGRTWTVRDYSSRWLDSATAEPGPGLRIRLRTGVLSRSLDGGNMWDPMPMPPQGGSFTAIAGAEGRLYAIAGSGFAYRVQARAGDWRLLIAAERDAIPSWIGAAGGAVCVLGKYGIACSRDGGRHFGFLGQPVLPDFSGVAMDRDRIYFATRAQNTSAYSLWSRGLEDSSSWRKSEVSARPLTYPMLAARDGILLVLAYDTSLASAFISRDQGRAFRESASPFSDTARRIPSKLSPVWGGALGRSAWAVIDGDDKRSDAGHLRLSSDSGRTWRDAGGILYTATALAPTDSAVYVLAQGIGASTPGPSGLAEFRLRDSTWHHVDVGGWVEAAAASDSALYAVSDGKILKRNLYDTPVRVFRPRIGMGGGRARSPRPAGIFPAADGRSRDALGKREEVR